MNISLTPQLEDFVKRKVNSGMYTSVSEVIREALRMMGEQEREKDVKLLELKREINAGLESLDKGEGIEGEEVFAKLREKSKAKRKKGKAN